VRGGTYFLCRRKESNCIEGQVPEAQWIMISAESRV
jgi:hypothetical protein